MSVSRQDVMFAVGRFVMGSLYEPRTTDAEGNPLVIKNGVNAGQKRTDYYIACAIPKGHEQHWAETEWGAIIWQFGHTAFPQGQASSRAFAWKIGDGDSTEPNRKGRKPVDREGHAGHWIIHFSGGFAPKTWDSHKQVEIVEKNIINPGDYIQIFGNVSSNQSQQQPGIYLNHVAVGLVGYGQRINVGSNVDLSAVGFSSALPAGASLTPVAPEFAPPPAVPPVQYTRAVPAPVAPAPYIPPVQAPATPAPYTPPVQAPAPYPQILTPAVAPPPMMPNTRVMTPEAGGVSYEQYIAAGWSDAQLVAAGKMQP